MERTDSQLLLSALKQWSEAHRKNLCYLINENTALVHLMLFPVYVMEGKLTILPFALTENTDATAAVVEKLPLCLNQHLQHNHQSFKKLITIRGCYVLLMSSSFFYYGHKRLDTLFNAYKRM